MLMSKQLYAAYKVAQDRVCAVYDDYEGRGMTWPEIADDETYRELVAESKKALDIWIKTWKGW